MAYAKYLSPEFHEWCNNVVRAHMEGRNLPAQAIQGAITLSAVDLDRFAAKIGEGAIVAARGFLSEDIKRTVEPRFDRIEVRLDDFGQAISDLQASQRQRKRPSKKTQDTHTWANHKLGGRCPCCSINRVCNSDGTRAPHTECDHFTQVDDPTLPNTWIVCAKCNKERLPMSRSECRTAFDTYQRRLKELQDTQYALPLGFEARL